jgi:hypothetical protein
MAKTEQLHPLCVAPAVRAGVYSAFHTTQAKGAAEWIPDSPSGFRDDDLPYAITLRHAITLRRAASRLYGMIESIDFSKSWADALATISRFQRFVPTMG